MWLVRHCICTFVTNLDVTGLCGTRHGDQRQVSSSKLQDLILFHQYWSFLQLRETVPLIVNNVQYKYGDDLQSGIRCSLSCVCSNVRLFHYKFCQAGLMGCLEVQKYNTTVKICGYHTVLLGHDAVPCVAENHSQYSALLPMQSVP